MTDKDSNTRPFDEVQDADASSTRPFDEVQDAASVAKGLALLQANPDRDPAHVFADTPLRSCLRGLKLPYALAPDLDYDNNASAEGEEIVKGLGSG